MRDSRARTGEFAVSSQAAWFPTGPRQEHTQLLRCVEDAASVCRSVCRAEISIFVHLLLHLLIHPSTHCASIQPSLLPLVQHPSTQILRLSPVLGSMCIRDRTTEELTHIFISKKPLRKLEYVLKSVTQKTSMTLKFSRATVLDRGRLSCWLECLHSVLECLPGSSPSYPTLLIQLLTPAPIVDFWEMNQWIEDLSLLSLSLSSPSFSLSSHLLSVTLPFK